MAPPHDPRQAPSGRASTRAVWTGAAAALSLLSLSADLSAGPMDPALSRLVLDPTCRAGDAARACVPDRASYWKLVSQWGFALAPAEPREARTSGLGALDVSLVATFTGVDSDAPYWRRGSRGSSSDATTVAVAENDDPDRLIALYALTLRKGFGFGVEAAASVGATPSSSLLAWGAELRVAPFEGLAGGAFAAVPDVSFGAQLREISGMSDLELSVLAIDARVSRPFVVDRRQRITPWLGYQWVHIHSEAPGVDLTPGTDPLASCGFAGENLPGTVAEGAAATSGAPPGVFDGAPLCRQPEQSDFENDASFGEADVRRHRVLVGVGYRRELLQLGVQAITDLVAPGDAQASGGARRRLECDAEGNACESMPRQWTLSLEVGARF